MPTELALGGRLGVSHAVDLSMAGILGFATADRFGAAFDVTLSDLLLTAGYQFAPDHPDAGGAHAGLSYDFHYGSETYSVRIGTQQKDELDWPVLAGLSVSF
jgi:hypothetical protein